MPRPGRLPAHAFAQLARDQVLYAELRFAPLLHTQGGRSAEQAVAQASAASGIAARVILCTLRHFRQAQRLATVRLVEQFRGAHVVALDIAGDEAGYPLDAHLAAFPYAIARGLPRTAHAGEARGAASVCETLRHLHPPALATACAALRTQSSSRSSAPRARTWSSARAARCRST